MFPENDDRQRVRDASDIVQVVGEHLSLKPKGREYVGLCPFHDDRNPSMCVIPTKQIFHCFVCGTGGDVFTFVQKYHSMGFREALEFLAQRANIELTVHKPRGRSAEDGEPSGVGNREVLAANDLAAGFFRAILSHPEHGSAAREVIERRGISDEMVERFMIGASPDRWDGLGMFAQSKEVRTEALLAAGLVKQRERGDGQYDALRNRLIFPICDQIGRVIAFGGRKIDEEDEPKYLNSPETAVFKKSTTLFGINHAARAIKRERTAVIVEGYTDVIACHQAGVEHVVGTLGTALTSGHATVLRRLCDTVVLLFDGDAAGIKAADRAIEVLLSETIDIRIAALAGFTDAKDPDELLKREDGAEVFAKVIEGSVDLIKWKFDRLRDELSGAGPARVAQRIEEELNRLSDLGLAELEPVRRRLMIRQIAQAARVEEGVVNAAIRTGRGRRRFADRGIDVEAKPEAGWKPDPREQLLGCLLYDDKLWHLMGGEQRELMTVKRFGSELSRVVADAMLGSAENGTGTGLHAVLDELAHVGEERGFETIDAEQRATMLRQMVARDTEGIDERVTRLFNECISDVAVRDARMYGEPGEV
ncbi:MAG TPA: DNA primase, partial [Phycisphaerales bacterium]|nr:DNA primase [Phycisphaerales bacterium]